jgi:hypothetical protein
VSTSKKRTARWRARIRDETLFARLDVPYWLFADMHGKHLAEDAARDPEAVGRAVVEYIRALKEKLRGKL